MFIEPWQRLLSLLFPQRPSLMHAFALDLHLHNALLDRASREQRSPEEIQAELITAGLERLQMADQLKKRWGTLSLREQQVTALACLGNTNKQMAARLSIAPETVKGYMRQALVKWNAHSKDELTIMLSQWDFSDWGPQAPF